MNRRKQAEARAKELRALITEQRYYTETLEPKKDDGPSLGRKIGAITVAILVPAYITAFFLFIFVAPWMLPWMLAPIGLALAVFILGGMGVMIYEGIAGTSGSDY